MPRIALKHSHIFEMSNENTDKAYYDIMIQVVPEKPYDVPFTHYYIII